jgi:hypothetical protein
MQEHEDVLLPKQDIVPCANSQVSSSSPQLKQTVIKTIDEQINQDVEKFLGIESLPLWRNMTNGVVIKTWKNEHPFYTLQLDRPYSFSTDDTIKGVFSIPQELTLKFSETVEGKKIEFLHDSLKLELINQFTLFKRLNQTFKLESMTITTAKEAKDKKIIIKTSIPGVITKKIIEKLLEHILPLAVQGPNPREQTFASGLVFSYPLVMRIIERIGFEWKAKELN